MSDPRSPDHLVVFLTDRDGHSSEWVDDDSLCEEFSLPRWVHEQLEEHPGAAVGATYPPHLMGRSPSLAERSEATWLDLTRAAVGEVRTGDERAFTGDTTPTSLSALRHWAMSRLADQPVAVDDVVLVLSELTTNVERHGGGWLTVDLVEREDDIVLAVSDPATDRLPAPREAGPDEPTGRGLLVVASVALRWGVVVRSSHKLVWAAFPHLR